MSDPIAIYHFHRLDDRITTSGQPTEAELADIAALGVSRVINLALPRLPLVPSGGSSRPPLDRRAFNWAIM